MASQFNVDALPLLVGHCRVVAACPLDFGVERVQIHCQTSSRVSKARQDSLGSACITLLETEAGQSADGGAPARHELVQLVKEQLLSLRPFSDGHGPVLQWRILALENEAENEHDEPRANNE